MWSYSFLEQNIFLYIVYWRFYIIRQFLKQFKSQKTNAAKWSINILLYIQSNEYFDA